MVVRRLKTFLDENGARYLTVSHSSAYTAQEIAAAAHIPGQSMAKSVMAKLDGKMTMLVLPAAYRVDLDLLKKAVGASTVELATEREFGLLFPDCETGAMPPFGNLYGLPVFVAASLKDTKEIAFNAGTHTEVVKLDFADFERLVKPTVLKFSERV
jgi:Ala-tRNA(Pro) deacylase